MMVNGIDLQGLALPGALLVLFTTLGLLTFQDWRVSLGILSLQYMGVFILVAIHWPFMMSLTKLIAGWIAVAVLGMAMSSIVAVNQTLDQPTTVKNVFLRITGLSFSAWVFRLLTALMIVLVVLTLAPATAEWIPGIRFEQVLGAFILLGLGLLHLGLTANPLRVVIALLTTLSGFEIIYATVPISTLVAGLLAGVNLGLALIGAYLLLAPSLEVEP
jgi:hypothetical protein